MNPQPKIKRIRCQVYIDWLKTQPCCITGFIADFSYSDRHLDVVPAHFTFGFGIMGGKGHDIFALPVRADLHSELEHHKGFSELWGDFNVTGAIFDHLKRFSEETGKVFWHPKEFDMMVLELIAEKWTINERTKQ